MSDHLCLRPIVHSAGSAALHYAHQRNTRRTARARRWRVFIRPFFFKWLRYPPPVGAGVPALLFLKLWVPSAESFPPLPGGGRPRVGSLDHMLKL